jgi:hypothetical protein
MTEQQVTVLLSAIVAVFVAYMTHAFANLREMSKQQREQRVSYLIEAFRALSRANNHPRLHEVAEELEQAISDIQLLGTPEQIGLARKVAADLASSGSASLNELMYSLRDSLRGELNEKPISGQHISLRVQRPESERPRNDA